MNPNPPIEVPSQELPALIARLRAEGKRAVNITVTKGGYRVITIPMRESQQQLLTKDIP